MIRADMIPDEVVERVEAVIARQMMKTVPYDPGDRMYLSVARAAIAAALNAWPGVTTTSWFENSVRKAVLNIPLPQEARDE